LDVVVERGGVLRFVEVKARAESDPMLADAVTDSKRRRLVSAARAWLLEYDVTVECAFLVALVRTGTPWQIEWIDNAFDVR
jgi:Holliday junction resolvase-like predicted endonuclease